MPYKNIIKVRHMLDAANEAVDFCHSSTFDEFRFDRKLINATVRSIEIIGEAASKTTVEFREENPEIAWRDIISMRNVLIHAYFDVDHEVVWKTVKEDLPHLIFQLEQLLI